ncbi:unnamed protein product [Allacma fusca]|uniref:Uncharacterized protein n=1 Tax=Allacma fusca TaxID=39272 RepID=A0A8J2LHG4_9HEXA|nr:unnamed protein product [Allacma fusca]
MKNCFYATSTTVTDSTTGKRRSLSQTGYIQYILKISGIRNNGKQQAPVCDAILQDDVQNNEDYPDAEEIEEMRRNVKKSLVSLGIHGEDNDVDSVRSFIDIVNPLADVNDIANQCDTKSAHIVCKGTRDNLDLIEFFVIFEKRALKAETLIGAVDLAFKIFYVFNMPFPASCSGT